MQSMPLNDFDGQSQGSQYSLPGFGATAFRLHGRHSVDAFILVCVPGSQGLQILSVPTPQLEYVPGAQAIQLFDPTGTLIYPGLHAPKMQDMLLTG